MNRKRLILAAVALVSMVAGALLFHLLQSDQGTSVSKSQPVELHSIPLTNVQGQQSTLGDWQGDILIVNFWAPWCVPCRREVPTLIKIQQQYQHKGIQILGIALDGRDQVSDFASEYQINYPLFLAGNRITMYNAAFGNPSGSLPFTALLDRKLKLLFQHNGEVTENQLRQQLEALL